MPDTASSSTLRLRKAMDAAKAALDRIPGAGGQESVMDDIRSASSGLPTLDNLTSLTFSHVQYTDDGLFSKIMAYTTLSPLWIICAYGGIILNGRDIKVALMLAGQLLNELLNLVLKRLVRQSRPTGFLGDGYGMPSSHAQFMAYFATYVVILMYRREVTPGSILPHIFAIGSVVWAALVIYSRVHLYYHTWLQVGVGAICGVAFALVYYWVIHSILRSSGLFEWLLDQPLVRRLHVRDTETINDVAKYEWEMWQEFRRSRHGKKD
ncbi:dolichyldiphosphatase [Entomortierella parvispora]|uniref:Dolichyldiphosphatase n=1 Tax=Entomortierella parvispora TaxID=205924 RepID=A0A9P3HDH8_9FUNG|nr:dolichyldiphosphatase [Entomortierella parvispora]